MATQFLLTIKHIRSAKRVAVLDVQSDGTRDWYKQAELVFHTWCTQRRRYRKRPDDYTWKLYVHACSDRRP